MGENKEKIKPKTMISEKPVISLDITEKIDTTEMYEPNVNHKKTLKPDTSEENAAIVSETSEKVDSAKPMKPKISRKERIKAKSSYENSAIGMETYERIDFT